MSALAAVLAGHLIGDWIVQTDWQAANKTSSWKANQQHMLGYHLTLALFCAFAMPPSSSSPTAGPTSDVGLPVPDQPREPRGEQP